MTLDPQTKNARRPVRIGKYEVVKHIATGGMGAVYKARDTDLERDVALKVLPPEMAASPTALERFRREARNAAKLRHENIVSIYEFGEVQGTWFLALEFIEGIDLYEYISRKQRLEPEEARRITIQAALAMQHAYLQGIVHRDIKPSNFLVTRNNDRLVVKMTDLGLSREEKPGETRVTRDGATVGTIDYMAPEQARDSSRADTRSDIYSLGCTLYHMLAGRPPFNEGGLTERLYAHVQDEPPDIREFNPRASEALMAVLRRMLAKQPADRYQTPAELVKDLLDVEVMARPVSNRDVLAGLAFGESEAEEEAGDDEEEPPRCRPPSPNRRVARPSNEEKEPAEEKEAPAPVMPRWVIAAAAGALILLGILAGLMILRRSGIIGVHPLLARRAICELCHYNNLGTIDERSGTPHALCIAGNASRWPGNGMRPGRVGTA